MALGNGVATDGRHRRRAGRAGHTSHLNDAGPCYATVAMIIYGHLSVSRATAALSAPTTGS